jgi:flagellin
MRINHNIAALNTYNKLSANTAATSKSLEKLSSGLKINRAGDNAAGLAISEKMRGQISGLNTSSSNASDGISLIQTAEGALNETQSILQRMRELAVQSSNDTNTDDDRVEIQKEIDQLTKEINRISSDTEFNTQKLLNGDKAIEGDLSALSGTVKDATYDAGVAGGTYTVTATVSGATATVDSTAGAFSGMSGGSLGLTHTDLDKGSYTLTVDATKNVATITDVEGRTVKSVNLADSKIIGDINLSGNVAAGASMSFTVTTAKKETIVVENMQGDEVTGINLELEADASGAVSGNIVIDDSKAIRFQIGANTGQGTSLTINDMGAKELGIDKLDLTKQENADFAITTIDKALTSVSSERAKLGAVQNRLEHTINNLGTSAENLSSAESRIRDVDMAKEMMEFTKNNILSQAAQSMLAQANQQPQNVLQLLQ